MRKLEKLGTWSRMFLLLSVLCLFTVIAQAQTVKGIVRDQNGDAIIGATVKILGARGGTVTDNKGQYSIDAPSGSILSISYVGYLTKQIRLRGENSVDVTLMEDNTTLNDIVVIGYGVQKKSDLTGAVASVKAEELKGLSTTDAAAALQGKASGVQVLNGSGAPGEGAKVRIRGFSSNSEKLEPLYIVDGLEVESIQYLDPSMIESMEVLKDAASAAIYGVKAGNGVVLITTKSGKKGTGTINYTGKFTNQALGNVPKLLNASEFKDWMTMQLGAEKVNGAMADQQRDYGWDPNTDTDWMKEYFEDTWATQHTLSFQGANDRGSYFTSVSYVNQDGIVKGSKDKYERLTAQINADYQIKDWLKIGTNNSIENWSRRGVSQNGYGTSFEMLLLIDPLTPVYWTSPNQMLEKYREEYNKGAASHYALFGDENGQYATSYFNQRLSGGNPFSQRDRAGAKDSGFNINGSTYLNFQPVKWLVYTSRLGYRLSSSSRTNFTTPFYLNSQSIEENYNIEGRKSTTVFYQWDNFVNFNQTFGKHTVGAMLGMSYQQKDDDYVSGTGQGPDILKGYASNFLYLDYLNANENTKKNITGAPSTDRYLSYFGRLIYSFDDRYSLQGNFRRDAADMSKLSIDNRWGTFLSASAGWTFSNEAFFKNAVDQKIISFGKIRASWGQNGNVNVLGYMSEANTDNRFRYIAPIAQNSEWYQFGESNAGSYGSIIGNAANPKLDWEKVESIDLGLDLRFLNSRLGLTVDWYKKTTKDLLANGNINSPYGFDNVTMAVGDVENSGIEVELSWKDNIGDFKYGISANMATLKNKVTYISPAVNARIKGGGVDGSSPETIFCYFEEGHPMWYMRGYKYLGVENGQAIYEDWKVNGETGKLELAGTTNAPSEEDMVDIGSGIPDVTYGITLNAEYKGIDLTVFGTGAAGNDVYYGLYRTGYHNVAKGIYDDFKSGGKFPELSTVAGSGTFWRSSAMVYDGSFFKIKQIQLGYTFPKSLTQKIAIDNLRAYISLDDFFIFTSYPGLDPETTTQSFNRLGLDRGAYPTMKKMVLGVSVTF
jgi:TonB-linked SusC/RagA family outer membrane protein